MSREVIDCSVTVEQVGAVVKNGCTLRRSERPRQATPALCDAAIRSERHSRVRTKLGRREQAGFRFINEVGDGPATPSLLPSSVDTSSFQCRTFKKTMSRSPAR